MKIAMLSTVHRADDVRITDKEARALAAAGHEVTVIARPGGKVAIPGVRVVGLQMPAVSRWLRPWVGAWAAWQAVRAVAPRVVQFHDPEVIPVGLVLKRLGYRVIYDAHEDVPADVMSKLWIPHSLRAAVAAAMGALERFAATRFDAVVAATPTIGARFASFGADVTVVRNYAKLEEFASLPSGPRKRCAVYVGRISFDRGLREMVEACGALELPLVLAGPMGEAERAALAGRVGVEWRGVLGRAEIGALLAEAVVGLCVLEAQPNYLDALPIKLFEYMAAGLPVVVSDLPLAGKIVEDAGCGRVVPAGDVIALVDALTRLLSHPDLAAEQGARGRAAVQAHYHWGREAESLVALYRRLEAEEIPK